MTFVSKFLRRGREKKAHGSLSFAQPYSPLEIYAETNAGRVADALVAESPAVARIARKLVRLVDDVEGHRALVKALHSAFEGRMRELAVVVDSPARYGFGAPDPNPAPHPLDRMCIDALAAGHAGGDVADGLRAAGWQVGYPLSGRVRLRIKIVLASFYLMWRSVQIPVRKGKWTVTPHRTGSLMANFTGADMFDALAKAADAAGYGERDRFTMLVERENEAPSSGYAILRPDELRVAVRDWVVRVLWPTWRMAFAMLPHAFAAAPETLFAAFEAQRIAATALTVWPKAMSVRCRTVIDNTDYLPVAAIKGAVFRKFGAKLVRWPGTEIDTYGSLLSNSPHDHFVSGGNYLSTEFSRNWRSPEGARTIGLVQADRRLAAADRVDPELRSRIEALHRDRKLLAYFGSSTETNMTPFLTMVLRAIVEVFNDQPGWFLVIKAKRWTSFMDMVRSLPEYPDWASNERIVFVDYAGDNSREICPVGWLAGIMDLGTGYFGSTLPETAARARPYCTHLPVVYDTPFMRRLIEEEVIVTDIDRFKRRLAEAMSGNPPSVPADWGAWAFDPYQDDRALERLSAILMDDAADTDHVTDAVGRGSAATSTRRPA